MSTIAYFIGKCLGDLPLVTMYSFIYAVGFMTVAAPASHFSDFYACIFVFEWCLFGLGMFFHTHQYHDIHHALILMMCHGMSY